MYNFIGSVAVLEEDVLYLRASHVLDLMVHNIHERVFSAARIVIVHRATVDNEDDIESSVEVNHSRG